MHFNLEGQYSINLLIAKTTGITNNTTEVNASFASLCWYLNEIRKKIWFKKQRP